MHITLTMLLPRDYATLPLVRHLTKHSLWEIGVDRNCVGDVELAVTEACANVVEHASGDDEYEVEIGITDETCEIRVIDTGRGFDFESLGRDLAEPSAEDGRGIQLMRALVDNIRFQSQPERGTIVHLVKQLVFEDRALPLIDRPTLRRSAVARGEGGGGSGGDEKVSATGGTAPAPSPRSRD